MVTLATLKKDLALIKAQAGQHTQVMPWEIPGLPTYRQAKTRQTLLQKITREPVNLPFNPGDYGRSLAYFEAWDIRAFDYYRDGPQNPAQDERIKRELAEKLLRRIRSSAAPTLTA